MIGMEPAKVREILEAEFGSLPVGIEIESGLHGTATVTTLSWPKDAWSEPVEERVREALATWPTGELVIETR